jgi:hypothetical protein
MLSDIAQCEELFHTATGTAFAATILLEQRFGTYPDGHSLFERHFAWAAVDRRPVQQCLLCGARA